MRERERGARNEAPCLLDLQRRKEIVVLLEMGRRKKVGRGDNDLH